MAFRNEGFPNRLLQLYKNLITLSPIGKTNTLANGTRYSEFTIHHSAKVVLFNSVEDAGFRNSKHVIFTLARMLVAYGRQQNKLMLLIKLSLHLTVISI